MSHYQPSDSDTSDTGKTNARLTKKLRVLWVINLLLFVVGTLVFLLANSDWLHVVGYFTELAGGILLFVRIFLRDGGHSH